MDRYENDAAVLRLLSSQYDLVNIIESPDTAVDQAISNLNAVEALTSSVGFNTFGGEFQFARTSERLVDHQISKSMVKGGTSKRRSQRRFLDRAIPISEFGELIAAALSSATPGKMAYPSAGGTYSVDLFVVDIHAVRHSGRSAVYIFDSPGLRLTQIPISPVTIESLRSVLDGYPQGESSLSALQNGHFEMPSVICLYMINKRRAVHRYLSRGIRFAMMEVGSIYQLLSDAASAGCFGSCMFGASNDAAALRGLGLNSDLYMLATVQVFGYVTQDYA